MLAKSLVWFSMAVLVRKTTCTPSFFCFPLAHFHHLSSFSHLILLCLHIKNKGFYITNFSSSILPKSKKPLWSHTFPTLLAYLTQRERRSRIMAATSELSPFLFSISHVQSIESLPQVSTVFITAPHSWSCNSFFELPSTLMTPFLSLPPISIFALSSLNYPWRNRNLIHFDPTLLYTHS